MASSSSFLLALSCLLSDVTEKRLGGGDLTDGAGVFDMVGTVLGIALGFALIDGSSVAKANPATSEGPELGCDDGCKPSSAPMDSVGDKTGPARSTFAVGDAVIVGA